MRRDDLSGGDFKRRKQRCRAMPLVVVALAGQGAAIGQLQIALRSLQSLDRRLFVHFSGGAMRPTTSAALAVKCGSLLSHQDLRATRSILLLRRNRQTYWTPQSPSPPAAGGRSSAQTPAAAVCPAASESACRWPSYRSAACRAGACLAVLQGHGRHSDAAKADNPRLDPNFLGYRAG